MAYFAFILCLFSTMETDSTNNDSENIQKVQNKMLRMVPGTRLLDKISTAKQLEETNMMYKTGFGSQ